MELLRQNLSIQNIGDRYLAVVTAHGHVLEYRATAGGIVGGGAGDAFSDRGICNILLTEEPVVAIEAFQAVILLLLGVL
jgi:hypothetical protein